MHALTSDSAVRASHRRGNIHSLKWRSHFPTVIKPLPRARSKHNLGQPSHAPFNSSAKTSTLPLLVSIWLTTAPYGWNLRLLASYVEGVLGYKFANEDLLREAIQAAPTYSGGLVLPQANRPLAMVGDKARDLILVSSGYKSGFSLKGINATRVIAENKNIAAAVDGKGLQKCITLNQGTFWDNPPQAYLLATAVEAILGALYLDSGDNLTVVKKGMASLGLIVGENGGDGHVAVAPGSTSDEAVREAADGALV